MCVCVYIYIYIYIYIYRGDTVAEPVFTKCDMSCIQHLQRTQAPF